jgi:hypothetical protein
MSDLEGFVRIPADKPQWLPLLRDLYRFEEPLVSGPGSHRRRFSDVIWTKEQAVNSLGLDKTQMKDFDDLLQYLSKNRQIMIVPKREESDEKYLTRVAELVRTIGHTYEYWSKGRPAISATRWLIEDKSVPKLVIPAKIFKNAVVEKCKELIPGNPGFNLAKAAGEVCEAVAKSIIEDDWESVNFSEFQLDSTLKIITSRYGPDNGYNAQVLTAGVGSGKTIGFSIATLIEARKTMLDGMRNQDRKSTSLFVYPRTQLAFDQFEELESFTNFMPCDLPIWLEMSKSHSPDGVARGVQNKYGSHATPFGIIVTTFETLKRRMRRPEFMQKMSKHLTTIVVDEVHLLSGISGGMSAQLLSRLAQAVYDNRRDIHWVGASATIARPDEHGGRLFGIERTKVQVVGPRDSEMEQAGINHHIFARPSQGMSLLGALTNVTSLTLHQRRNDLSFRPRISDEKRAKSIGFADNLEMLGRWNDDFRENERTQQINLQGTRKHPKKNETMDKWTAKQREIPYAWRFNKPLQRRLAVKGGNDKDSPGDAYKDLTGLFGQKEAKTVCNSCHEGTQVILGKISPDDLFDLKKLVYRTHHKEKDEIRAIIVDSDEFKSSDDVLVGSHELCPFLQAGACTWFPQPSTDKVFEIPGTTSPNVEFAATARSTVFSSKSISAEGEEDEKGITSKIFKATSQDVFDAGGRKKRVPVDIVLASPSLEVGVDLPMLTESILVKSVRNIASYRQKVGRVGRERNLDTVNVTLMTESNVDLHYYRQPRKLVSEGKLEPVPLMDNNRAIIACSAYGAVWEWLALYAGLPEYIRGKTDGSLGQSLQNCLDSLKNKSIKIESYICNALTGSKKYIGLVKEAINQVIDEISLLLLPASPTFTINPKLNFIPKVIDLFGINIYNKSPGGNKFSITKSATTSNVNVDKFDRLIRNLIEYVDDLLPYNVNFNDEQNKILSDLRKSLNQDNCQIDELKNVVDEFTNFDSLDEEGQEVLGDLLKAIERLIKEISKSLSSGSDPAVISMYDEYDELESRVFGGKWKRVYLSDVMDNLSEIQYKRRDSWYLRPNTLFENPYTKKVKLEIQSLNPGNPANPLDPSQSEININEAIFGFLPGTWNHRIPHRRLKVRTGQLTPSGGWVFAKLGRMKKAGNEFRNVHPHQLPSPPGSDTGLLIYAPERLTLIESFGKYVRLNKNTLQVMDKDESDFDHPAMIQSKVPRSFQNRWAWSIDSDKGQKSRPFCLPEHKYQLEDSSGAPTVSENGEGIIHPLLNTLIGSIEWFEEKEIVEYTYGISRSFSGKGEITLGYRDDHDRTIGFGEKYKTQAIGFTINEEVINKLRNKIESQMVGDDGEISPSMIKCLKAFVLTNTENQGAMINAYTLDDLISILMIFNNWNNSPLTPKAIVKYFLDAKNNLKEFKKTTEEFIRIKMRLDQKYTDEDEENFESDTLVSSRIDYTVSALEIICSFIKDFEKSVPLWVHRTVLSTFGVIATNSLQQFCGSDDNDISYLIEESSWKGESTRVIVYDKVDFGNGSCKAAFEYMHIPHVIRASKHSVNAKLPSTDYLSTLEENLLQCMQFQSDLGALELIQNPASNRLSSMPDLVKHAKENYEVGGDTWSSLGIKSMDDAWTLPLHTRLAPYYEKKKELAMDDVIRSCTICWNGCPECVDQLHNVLGGMLGMNFVDKYLIDDWFNMGIEKSNDYQYLDFSNMADGSAEMHFGSLNKLHLITPENESKRSICLPWTMGFHIQKRAPFSTTLVVRSTDISNLRIGGNSGGAHGIDRHGFERLLWFDLLMSSHLDAVRALDDDKKELQLLYYDARDLKLKDLGLSPRMLDSMMAVGDGQQLEKLSDVIIWMAKRGFAIKLCVDKNQATNQPVRDFLERINVNNNITILQRVSETGSMHKKMLITPIAALTGSANLTYSGSSLNDETLVHVTANNVSEYESIKAGARTTLRDAEEFDFNYTPTYSGNRTASNPIHIDPLDGELEQIIQTIEQGVFRGEDLRIECKSSYSLKDDKKNMTSKDSTDVVFREVAGMMNTVGGHVFVGIEDRTWNVLGIDEEINERKDLDSFLGEVNSHLKHNLTEIFGSFVKCQVKQILGKRILVISTKPCKSKKVWFNPRGSRLKRSIFDEDYGCLFVRNDDNTDAITRINALSAWSEIRFGAGAKIF